MGLNGAVCRDHEQLIPFTGRAGALLPLLEMVIHWWLKAAHSNYKCCPQLLAGSGIWSISSSNVHFLRTFGCSGAGWKISLIMECWKGRQELRLNTGFDRAGVVQMGLFSCSM